MSVMIRCDGPLREAIRAEGLDTIDGAFAYEGGELLSKPGLIGRRRRRLTLADETGVSHVLYLKCYDRRGLGSALGRWLTTGRRLSRAAAELAAIDAVRSAGVETMKPLACGDDASWRGRGRGFLLVTAVEGDALERCAEDFLTRNAGPDGQEGIVRLTSLLAELVGRLHASGHVHRDLYASHVFLDEADQSIRLSLIDLARVFHPRWRRRRWRVKDVAQLKYSMPPAWVGRWWPAFLEGYGRALGRALPASFDAAVDAKVAEMTRRRQRREGRS